MVPVLAAVVAPAQPAYVSLVSALHLHGMIEQIPQAIHVVLPVQRRSRRTAVGRVEFFRMERELIGGYEPGGRAYNFDLATPAKALFDALYLSVHRGQRFTHFPELTLGPRFRTSEMEEWIARVRGPHRRAAVASRWSRLRVTLPAKAASRRQ
jgi:predicted transcriptional regulator of viral defense system